MAKYADSISETVSPSDTFKAVVSGIVLTVDNVIQTWVGDAYVSANNLIMPGKMTISGNTVIKSAIVANNTPGTAGYYLRSSGTGVYWSPVSGVSLSSYATWAGLTATNTAIRTSINSTINSTNTALRTLVSDRLQVANAVATYATKASPTTSGVFAHTGRATISTNLSVTGNTGIGSSAAEAQVTISHATAPTLYISETGGTGAPVLWLKQYGTTGEGLKVTYDSASGHSYINNVYSGGSLFLQTVATTRLSIDSSGRVLKPYQPAFFASGSGGTIAYTVGSYITFNTLNTTFAGSNRNSGYNTGTYLYTAPVAGLYQFYVQLYLGPSSRNNSITWWKNGSQLSYGNDAAQAVYFSTNSSTAPDTLVLSGAVIMELAASDYVGLQVRTSFGTVSIYMGHSSFWGYLIG